jgi:hypothetical protein
VYTEMRKTPCLLPAALSHPDFTLKCLPWRLGAIASVGTSFVISSKQQSRWLPLQLNFRAKGKTVWPSPNVFLRAWLTLYSCLQWKPMNRKILLCKSFILCLTLNKIFTNSKSGSVKEEGKDRCMCGSDRAPGHPCHDPQVGLLHLRSILGRARRPL